MAFKVTRSIREGIERVIFHPEAQAFETPIVFQHGMWHNASCWKAWQELFAEWGWETIAYSLPGHGRSMEDRPIRKCTLDYYLRFLQNEIASQPVRPIVVGHSMGGALLQRYLKNVGDHLPAAVFVAPWTAHAMMPTIIKQFWHDFFGAVFSLTDQSATPIVRNEKVAAKALITEGAILTPEQLFDQLGPESLQVLFQHNPPFWTPPEGLKTPMMWIAAGADRFFSVKQQKRSAEHYNADYFEIEGQGHNLMIERGYKETARLIHDWLNDRAKG